MIVPIPDCGKGLNKDLLPAELDIGVWSDATNFRFKDGFSEKWEGCGAYATSNNTAKWVAVMNGANGAVETYIVYYEGGAVYALDTNSAYASTTLTRYTQGQTISSITRAGTTATLTTAANHGRATGDQVIVAGATPSQYNGTYTITVTSATTFTYAMASDPGASASPVGIYEYTGAASNFTEAPGLTNRPITGGFFNGYLIFNHPVDGLYYWNGDTAGPLRRMPGAPTAVVSRPFGSYIVQLYDDNTVGWSNATEDLALPTSFTASATNDAGDFPLAETPGSLMDCLPLGDVNIIYKQDARYAMRWVGGNEVFSFTRLPGADGLFLANCVVDTPRGHVFLTPALDVRIHQGGDSVSIVDGKVGRYLFNLATNNSTARRKSFAALNPTRSETWMVIHESLVACTILVWNWSSDTWTIFVPPALISSATNGQVCTAGGASPAYVDALILGAAAKVGITNISDDGSFLGTATITGTLERTGLHFNDRSAFKTLQRSRWNIDGDAGDIATISHGSSKTADGTTTYASSASYTIGTSDFVNARATAGRFVAVKLSTTAYPMKIRSIDLDVTSGGSR